MEYLTSFAQFREDIILYHVLHDVEKIFWIDVGANDPVRLSVTKFFSLRGGTGINIEPQLEYKKKYSEDRPGEINLSIGIGEKEGEMVIYGRGVSASVVERKDALQQAHRIPVATLASVCEKHVPEGQDIHFLKIDVEGFEKPCLLGMDFKKYKPWTICIEGTEKEYYETWEYILTDNGYRYAFSRGANRYYYHESKEDLKERFLQAEKIDELYHIADMSVYLKDTIYKDAYEEVINSRSWKITKPLRDLDILLKKVKNK